jgi:hypothetical protein
MPVLFFFSFFFFITAVGGGVLIALICALFGLLVPCRIIPRDQAGESPDSAES